MNTNNLIEYLTGWDPSNYSVVLWMAVAAFYLMAVFSQFKKYHYQKQARLSGLSYEREICNHNLKMHGFLFGCALAIATVVVCSIPLDWCVEMTDLRYVDLLQIAIVAEIVILVVSFALLQFLLSLGHKLIKKA